MSGDPTAGVVNTLGLQKSTLSGFRRQGTVFPGLGEGCLGELGPGRDMPEMQQERPWHLCSLAAFQTAPLTGSCWVSGSSAFVLSCFSQVSLFVISWAVAGQPPLDFPGKNNGVDCQVLLQGIFLIQGSNSSLYVSCIGRWALYH